MLDRRLNLLFPRLLPLLFVFLLPSLAVADFSGRVVGVADGDTITVLKDKTPVKVRLHGIDAPEKKQAFGNRAKQFTSSLAFGKDVTIKEHGLDKYGRDYRRRDPRVDADPIPPWDFRKIMRGEMPEGFLLAPSAPPALSDATPSP